MAKTTNATNERFEHALHNEQTCEYLRLKDDYKDWVITTAFYSALHFVSSKIFPFKVPAIEGKQTEIISIDQYFNYVKAKSKALSKHELMLELIDKNFTDNTWTYYSWLLSAATTARYSHYQYQLEIANRAIDYLKKIKKSCEAQSKK